MNDKKTTLAELKELVETFSRERGWERHHDPKSLAMSICIEAAELLEQFQWDEYRKDDTQKMADELADIMVYALTFAVVTDIDIASSIISKLERAKIKYPVELFNPTTVSKDAFHRIKQDYRKGKTSDAG